MTTTRFTSRDFITWIASSTDWSGLTVAMSRVDMSASRVVVGSLPLATARTTMSRSVTIPSGLPLSITTTEPIRNSLIALAASATDASAFSDTGSLVMTSLTVLATTHLQHRNIRYEKNAWSCALTPHAPGPDLIRNHLGISCAPARYRVGGAWPAMAEPSTIS